MTKKNRNKDSVSRRNSKIATVLGLVFAAVFTIAVALPSSYAADSAEPRCSESCQRKAELPREWKWKKPNINFDHMYPSDK